MLEVNVNLADDVRIAWTCLSLFTAVSRWRLASTSIVSFKQTDEFYGQLQAALPPRSSACNDLFS
jgi:hypothetical protein